MELIVCAHKGEAQAIIQYFEMQKVKGLNTLFSGDEYDLLISGEGLLSSALAISSQLASKKYSMVTNLGIAGMLKGNWNPLDVISIRTVYGYFDQVQYHSFTSADRNAKQDCLTTLDRVLNLNQKQKYLPFAHVVDRELYSLGMACKKMQLPWKSLKCISDHANEATNCNNIHTKAQLYSQKLCDHFLKLENMHTKSDHFKTSDEYHFTFSMDKQLQKSLKKAALLRAQTRTEIWQSIDNELKDLDILPKKKAAEALRLIEDLNRHEVL